jgi:hypothetical protein
MILVAVAASLFVSAAQAQVTTLYQAGAWRAVGGVADDGKAMCGVDVRGADRMFMVKWFVGDDHLVVHLYKRGWVIPPGARPEVSIQFDGQTPWIATATGTSHLDVLELTVHGGDTMYRFVAELRFANRMVVRFPTGNEGNWEGVMTGSNAAILAMIGCIRRTGYAPPTQPYMSQLPTAPTQPYGRPAPAPTQPFAAPPAQPIPKPAPVRTPPAAGDET